MSSAPRRVEPASLGDPRELEAATRFTADALLQFWAELGERPAVVIPTDDELAALDTGLPRTGVGVAEAIERTYTDVILRSTSRGHPRTFPFVDSSGLEVGVLADALAGALNANVAGGSGAASWIEERAWRWIAEFVGFPGEAGTFTSGGTIANLTGLAAARVHVLPTAREAGNGDTRLAVYASTEAHHSIERSCELLGLGRRALRQIPVDERFRMRPDALAAVLERDLAEGVVPLAVCATVGTTSTGSVDPLDEIADVCQANQVWLHVDAAYGAPAAAAPSVAARLEGLARADTVVVDPHKWLYVPKAAGLILARDPTTLRRTFSDQVRYLEHDEEGPLGGPPWPVLQGIEFTHDLRGLKVWTAFLAYGADGFVEAIERDLEHARMLVREVRRRPDLELLDEPQLSVVVFRHTPSDLDERALNTHNRALLDAIQRDGRVLISGTTLRFESGGRTKEVFALRPCFTGHRTRPEDVVGVAQVAEELGRALAEA